MCSFQTLQLTIVNSRPQSVAVRVSKLRTKNRPIFIIIRFNSIGIQSTLMHSTPGLSDSFYEEQMWSDKCRPVVYIVNLCIET